METNQSTTRKRKPMKEKTYTDTELMEALEKLQTPLEAEGGDIGGSFAVRSALAGAKALVRTLQHDADAGTARIDLLSDIVLENLMHRFVKDVEEDMNATPAGL